VLIAPEPAQLQVTMYGQFGQQCQLTEACQMSMLSPTYILINSLVFSPTHTELDCIYLHRTSDVSSSFNRRSINLSLGSVLASTGLPWSTCMSFFFSVYYALCQLSATPPTDYYSQSRQVQPPGSSIDQSDGTGYMWQWEHDMTA
jgi:hypothetical protein